MGGFEDVTLWCLDWIESDGVIDGWGMTMVDKYSERSDCYVQIQDWDEILCAYQELKQRLQEFKDCECGRDIQEEAVKAC
jgi:hypothetical protein